MAVLDGDLERDRIGDLDGEGEGEALAREGVGVLLEVRGMLRSLPPNGWVALPLRSAGLLEGLAARTVFGGASTSLLKSSSIRPEGTGGTSVLTSAFDFQ